MALLNQKGFERKLQQMSSAQDSVQTVSLWIIHHKKYANDIVKVWMEQLKKCNPDRRLIMLYLANDVLQNSRKKGKEFSTAFSKVLKEVVPLLCEKKIVDSVQRVIKIWHERKVFDKDFLESLQRKFETLQSKPSKAPRRKESNGEGAPVERERLAPSHHHHNTPGHTEKRLPPADFKPQQLIDALKAMRDFQAEVTLKESHLNSLRIDASDMEAIKQLKDRATGAKFTSEYETASEKLESFCETLNQEKEEISKLIQILDDGKSFYDSAFGEVKVIVHAYKTFGNRLNSLKKKVDHKVAKIINAEAEKKKMGPITTPQASFLTSGLPDISSTTPSSTPPHTTEEGDKTEKVADTTVDNTEVADMDIEEDGDSENGETSETPSETASTPSTESKTSETAKSDTSVKPQVAITTASSQTPSSNTSVTFSTSSAMSVQVPVPQQMVIPQPNMQFIPGQPGMAMVPVGMPGTGQFIHMPTQYHQQMVPFGMPLHGMSTFPGNVQTPMPGILPGQAAFSGQNIGLVSNLPQQIQHSMSVPQVSVPSVQAGPGQTVGQITTTIVSSAPAQVTHTTTNPSTASEVGTRPLPSIIPSTDPSEVTDSRPESIDSPGSEMSAPSPVGSPELELGGDETPETASPQRISEVKILGFPSMSSQPENNMSKEASESTSSPSTGSVTPNHTSEPSKPVTAVNILAQLISRGRKLKEQTPDIEVPSEASTPKEEVVESSQPQQEKPLFSLIDSLFPKLTDSLKTLREREKDNETSTSTSEEGSPKQKIEINSMEDDNDPEADPGLHGQGPSLEHTDKNIEHRGPFKGPYHTPTGHPQEGPMGPYGIRPPEAPVRQPWNNAPFQGHPGAPRPPFREYPERPHITPSSPLKGPGHSPRFPGPQRPFEGPPGGPFGPSSQAEFMDSEGIREEYRPGPERSPRQLHSPRVTFPNRPSPGGPGGYLMERCPPLGVHPEEPPINGPPRSPRGSFVGVGPPDRRPPHGMPREDQRPHFHFDGPQGNPPRPPGPPDVYRRPGGSPRHSPIDGPPQPRWRGPEGPRGPLPPPQDGRPRGFQRSHSDGGPIEMGEPPMKRAMIEEGHPQPYPEPGRPVRFPPDERVPIDRNREVWRERDPWDPHREPHLGPRPDRGRPPNEFHEREEHLPPRFIEHERFPPPRRNSFKGYDEHYMEQRPRLPFPGPRPRPFF